MEQAVAAIEERDDAVLWRPDAGWVGDVIPFFHDGWFWLYYLHDWRGIQGRPAATSWHLVRTRDLVTYEDLGEVLPHGGPDDQDRNCYTGSIVEADGRFHCFYTGYNATFVDPADGLPVQVVMHAVSDDLIHWEKLPGDTFGTPPGIGLESHDWRDPFVFHDPDPAADRWLMLLAGRRTSGLPRRRGVTALASSKDLVTWTAEPPFWDPGLYITHECPEVFPMGEWWYLTFSEFSERFTAQYRMSRHPLGPWRAAADPSLDGRAWYAPRTAAAGDGPRYAFGWIATREDEHDAGAWQWAGTMAVHELVQREDGTIGVTLPAPIRASFPVARPAHPRPVVGDWSGAADGLRGEHAEGFGLARLGAVPARALLTATVTLDPGTRGCGVALALGDDDPDAGYFIRLEPPMRRVVFDRWPRRAPGHHQWMIAGDVPHAVELERSIELEPGVPHRLEILVDGSALIAYVDGSVAMSARIHDRPQGDWGVFVSEGAATFSDLSVRVRRATGDEPPGGGS
jgi:beta-fructofuranosidase